MKKLLLGIGMFALSFSGLYAQQQAQFSQYMMNSYLINPALAGTEDYVDTKVGYRNQWGSSFNGEAPKTFYVSAHSPIAKPHEYYHHNGEHTNWHGVGGLAISDKTGPTSANSFYASYSYNMGIVKPKGTGIYKRGGVRASMGLFLGMKQYKIDLDKLTFENSELEPIASVGGNVNQMVPDASVGAWVYSDIWYVGLSAMQLLGNEVKFSGLDVGGDASVGKLNQHYYITAGGRVELSQLVDWIPSVLIKGVSPAPLAVDINSRFDYDKKYYAGLSYRHKESMVFMCGAVINYMFEIGYSYDYVTNELNKFGSKGSHEVLVGFRINPHNHLHNAERFWK